MRVKTIRAWAVSAAAVCPTAVSVAAMPIAAMPVAPQTMADGAIEILEGHHHRLKFDRSVSRVAVGNPAVLDDEVVVLNDREVLLLGKSTGRTTLMVWFEDGVVETQAVAVKRDFSALESALRRIDANIRLEVAPDRDALVLSGLVPDLSTKTAAVRAAEAYLSAGSNEEQPAPIVGEDGALVTASDLRPSGSVLDLLTVARLPEQLEERLGSALIDVGVVGVEVHRFRNGDLPNDEADLFVLTGGVESQASLTRALQLAGRLVTGTDVAAADIRVVSDESGGFANGKQVGGGNQQNFGQNLGLQTGSSNLFGQSGGIGNLTNRLGINLARANAVSVAGRILSFVEVRDLPQVRVGIRIYEVNRTDLLSYSPDFAVLTSDFDQGSLNPASGASTIQGTSASRVGAFGDDIQNVLSFLADGFGQQTQLSAGGVAIDAALRVLETRGIARNLSGPSLTVLSGERAVFQVGGEVPVPQAFSPAFGTADGGAAGATPGVFSSVVFRPFGVQLGVRPLVGKDDFVTLDLVTQVARPDTQLTTLIRESTGSETLSTAFETRSLQTSARLGDGESLVLGGLIQRRQADDASYAPWIESVPLIGWLFKRFSIEDDDQEIVVIVNPNVVRDPIAGVDLWIFPDSDALQFGLTNSGSDGL